MFTNYLNLKTKTLTALCAFGLCTSAAFSQTWKDHSLVNQNYPNNDVKSYGGKLWVANNDGLFSSSDNGDTWTEVTSNFGSKSDLVEIQFTKDGNIFVRKNSFGVVRSLDGGSTWELDTNGVGSNYGTDLLYYDETSDKVFLGVGYPKYKLYYQSPSDVAWTEVTNLPAGLNNFSPVQMTRKSGKLFLIDAYKRVLESSDDGAGWTKKNGTGLAEASSQVGPGRFLAIGDDLFLGVAGVWKSSDDGDSWTKIDQGFASSDTRCLYYDGTTLYTSVYSQRMTYKSTDKGATWTDFGGTGSWFFKAMAKHNGALFGVIHSKDSIYSFGNPGGGTNGISDIMNTADLKIYPNPAQNQVTIEETLPGSVVKITDVTGKVIYSTTSSHEQTTINTATYTNGVYLIQIENKGTVTTGRFVVSK